MKKYIRSTELSGPELQKYINKIQKEVERDLEDIVADLDWSMQDDQVYLSVTYKDDNFTNTVFVFEPWRFTGMTSYIPEDVDMVVGTVENFAKKHKLFNEPYWEKIDKKTILDYDGFTTEYTLYYNEDEDRYICIFGDSDIYTPETADPDWEGETYEEAREWFDSYRGPGEEDEDWMNEDIDSSCNVTSSEDSTGMHATDVVRWMYNNYPDWAFYDEHELADGRIQLKFELGPKNQRADLEEDLEKLGIYPVIRNRLYIIVSEDPEYVIESSEEFFDKGVEDAVYWYRTTHGVQPGSIPKGLDILKIVDRPDGTYFSTNRVITTDALKYYDIKEKSPYVKSSQDYGDGDYYSQKVSMDLDPAVETVISSDVSSIDYRTLKSAVDAFFEDLKKIPSGRYELNIEYDRDKGRIYKKYRSFADRCKEISKILHPTGYGKNDFIDVKKQELCKSVDWNFPYGWKTYI